jgi:DNA-binding transcriptional LysR family regulator
LISKKPGLMVQKVVIDRLCAFVPEDHPLAQKQSIALSHLVKQTVVLSGRENSVRELFARAGLGIAVLSESSIELLSERLVRCIQIKSADLTRRISILRKSGRSLTPTAEAFVQSLIKPRAPPIASSEIRNSTGQKCYGAQSKSSG